MSFFPLCNALNTKGFCTMHNFSPNNWEKIKSSNKTVWALYSNGEKWITKELDILQKGESKAYYYDDFELKKESNVSPIVLLQFRNKPLERELDYLPSHEFMFSKTPEWRATIGFQLNNSETKRFKKIIKKQYSKSGDKVQSYMVALNEFKEIGEFYYNCK